MPIRWRPARWLAVGLLLTALPSTIVAAQPTADRTEWREVLRPPTLTADRFRYGSRYWQTVDFVGPAGGRTAGAPAPLVVILPDLAFRAITGPYPTDWLAYRLQRAGFAVATIAYQDPGRDAATTAADNGARAIALLRAQAGKRGFDPDRIVLIGIGSGAQFAALLATDERRLTTAGVPFESVAAMVSINGDGFDLPARIAEGGFRAKGYLDAFGKDAAVHRTLSPVSQLAAPNVPSVLLMTLEQPALADQARRLKAAFDAAGVKTTLTILPPHRSDRSSTFLALPGGTGEVLLDYLAVVTKQRPR